MEWFAIGADNCALLDLLSNERKAVLMNAICAALRGSAEPEMDEPTKYVFNVLVRDGEKVCPITKSSQTLQVDTENQERIKEKVCTNVHTKEKKERKTTLVWDDIFVWDAFRDWEKMRKQIKKPLTDLAKTRAVNKLEKLSGGDKDKAIAILEQSTDHCWQDLYELKDEPEKPFTLTKTQSLYGQRSEKVQRAYGFSTERDDIDYNAIAWQRTREAWGEEE